MGMKEAESILARWREVERSWRPPTRTVATKPGSRIRELRDRYQALVAEVYDVEAAGGPAEGARA